MLDSKNEKQTKRQVQAMRTRRKILDTALAMTMEDGIQSLSIRGICDAAGVSIGSFYHYFSSLDDIVIEVEDVSRRVTQTIGYLDQLTQTVSGPIDENTPPLDQFVSYFMAQAKHTTNRGPEATTTTMTLRLKHKDSKVTTFSRKRPFYKLICDFVREKQAAGYFIKEIPAEEICDVAQATFRGLMFNWCSQNGEFDYIKATDFYVRAAVIGFVASEYRQEAAESLISR